MEATTTSETTYRAVLTYGDGTGTHKFISRETAAEAWDDVTRLAPDLLCEPHSGDTLGVEKTTVTTTTTEVKR